MDGQLALYFTLRQQKTIMKDVYYQPPLKASRGLYVHNPGDISVYLMESSGGLVAGDTNTFDVKLDNGTTVTLHPQAATKVYPAYNGKPSKQQVRVKLADKASLTWKREEVIPFAESDFSSHTIIDMKRDSKFYWEEILYPGREKRGETFTFHACRTQLEVWMEDDCIVYDQLVLQPDKQDLKHAGVLGNYHYIASVWLVDQDVTLDPEAWNETSEDHVVSTTRLRNAGYLIRFLSNDLPRVKREMERIAESTKAVRN
ncbi:urease accessory protein UreD [Gracilibacillus caseinilyticus]|uniref:Urease accessory protein UreD n=1 Tax=Gracilibacillus caseinilyticus TaxID=2932256 RepID=A0ABY4EXF6_9BACI|nr:urease accessory protein UreD [Gracilibacillus caseinilyticus]UOQ48528.1 urease accessory protein UreD [Gracilibacillus caseinilyticus]